jgi:hypothetical protein
MMNTNNISRMVLFDQGAEGDWATIVFLRHRDRFNLFFTKFCYNGRACYTAEHIDVPRDPNLVKRVKTALDSGLYTGIGELSLRHSPGPCCPWGETRIPVDHPRLLGLYDLLASRGLPIIIHDELSYQTPSHQWRLNQSLMAELERALDHNNSTIIILAHGSDLVPYDPMTLLNLMQRHSNLYADLSFGLPAWTSLTEESRHLLEKHADRFMIGFDFQTKDQTLELASDMIRNYRMILGQLDGEASKAIAFQNMVNILTHNATKTLVRTTTTVLASSTMTVGTETATLPIVKQTTILENETRITTSTRLVIEAFSIEVLIISLVITAVVAGAFFFLRRRK